MSTNYHLMIDDKFVDGFISEMEDAVPGRNVYIFNFDPPSAHQTLGLGVHAPYGSDRFRDLSAEISAGDRVLVHWLHDDAARFIINLPQQIEVAAFFWGGDFIADPFYFHKRNLLGPMSLRFYDWNLEFPILISPSPVTWLYRLGHRLLKYKKIQLQRADLKRAAVSRLDRLFHWSLLDHRHVERLYKTSLAPAYFFYDIGIHKEVPELRNSYISRSPHTRIWLGNSATITNNHFEALEVLGRHKHRDVEIICPLSYGDKLYADAVCRRGERLFGSRFRALTEYLDRKVYYALMDQVDVVLMNHYRTQAAGNIWAFLKMGKKIFMNPANPLYQLLVGSGIRVFDLHRGGVDFDALVDPLSRDIAAENYNRTNALFSLERKRASLGTLT